MKKTISLVLALVMTLSLCPFALADDGDNVLDQIKKVVAEKGQYDSAKKTYTLSKVVKHTKITEPKKMNDSTTYTADEEICTDSVIYNQTSGEITLQRKIREDYVLKHNDRGGRRNLVVR